MRKAMFVLLLAGFAVAAPATAGVSVSLKGVVIAKSSAPGKLVVAAPSGRVTTLRTAKLVAPGTVISVSASGLRVIGHVKRAAFRAILVKSVGASSFFNAGGSLIVVHRNSRTLASARATPALQPGEAAEIDATITPSGALNASSITPTPAADDNATETTLQVTVAAVTPATATTAGSLTLTINGQTLVIPLPAGTVLPVGIVANATVNLKIEFQQPGADDDGNGDDSDSESGGSGDESTTAVGAQLTTTQGTGSATFTGSGSSREGDGGHDGRGGSGHDGGGHD